MKDPKKTGYYHRSNKKTLHFSTLWFFQTVFQNIGT